MFCIVRCDRCGVYQGAKYPLSTSRCRTCDRTIDIRKNPPLGRFQKEEEMRRVLWTYRSGGSVDEKEILSTSIDVLSEKRTLASMRNREERTNLVLKSIGDGTVTKDDLMVTCSEAGMERNEFELILGILLEKRVLFEPRTDRFSKVK